MDEGTQVSADGPQENAERIGRKTDLVPAVVSPQLSSKSIPSPQFENSSSTLCFAPCDAMCSNGCDGCEGGPDNFDAVATHFCRECDKVPPLPLARPIFFVSDTWIIIIFKCFQGLKDCISTVSITHALTQAHTPTTTHTYTHTQTQAICGFCVLDHARKPTTKVHKLIEISGLLQTHHALDNKLARVRESSVEQIQRWQEEQDKRVRQKLELEETWGRERVEHEKALQAQAERFKAEQQKHEHEKMRFEQELGQMQAALHQEAQRKKLEEDEITHEKQKLEEALARVKAHSFSRPFSPNTAMDNVHEPTLDHPLDPLLWSGDRISPYPVQQSPSAAMLSVAIWSSQDVASYIEGMTLDFGEHAVKYAEAIQREVSI